MKRLALFLLLSVPALAQNPVAAYVNPGTGWSPWTAASGSGSTTSGITPVNLYCEASSGPPIVWQPCNPSSSTVATAIAGGSLGSVPYQSAPSTTLFVSPQISTSTLCLTETGTGTIGAAPVWGSCAGSAATAFSALTGSTNTSAAMVIGTGASLTVSGTGTNNATSVNGNTFPVSAGLTSGGLIYGSSTSAYASDADFTISSHTLSGGSSALISLAATNALTLSAMSGTSCLEEVSGVVTATGFGCGTTLSFPLTVSGTTNSGGIPYFSNSTTLTASAALASTALVVGGGAGGAPTTGNGDFTYATHTLSGGSSALVSLAATNALTLSAMSGTNCLEEVSGVVTSYGSGCGANISGGSSGQVAIFGSSTTITSGIALGTSGSDIPQLSSGLLAASILPKATTAAFGAVEGDNSTITLTAGVISCTTATTSQIGCVKPDGSTITISGGVISSTALVNPMTTLGDTLYGGVSGAVTRLAGPTAGAATYVLTDVTVGSSAVAPTWTNLATYLASPPAIGATSANTGAFTTLTASTSLAIGTTPPTACGSATGIWCATEASTAGTPTSGQGYIRLSSSTHQYVVSVQANSSGTEFISALNYAIGTSGGTVPLLNTANTYGALQTFALNASIGSTAHGVIISENTSAIAVTATGSTGQPLISAGSGSDPAYGTLGIGGGGTGATTQGTALINLLPVATRVGDILYCETYSGTCTQWGLLAGNTGSAQFLQESSAGVPSWASGGGGDSISSPNSTITVGGTSSATTIDVVGAAGEILAGSTPALTYTPQFGVDNSHAGTLALSNGSAAAHTIFGSAATTTNTILGPATVVTTLHLMYCVVSSTTCTLTDTGYAYNAIPLADLATQSADTMVMNLTAGTAAPTAVAFPTTAHGIWLAEGTTTAPSVTAAGGSNLPLIGQGSSADPVWSTIAYPTSLTSGGLLYGSNTTTIASDADFTISSHTLSGGSSAILDMSAGVQLKQPVTAAYASAANGECGYDSTNLNWHCWQNAADNFMAVFPVASPPTSGHLAGFLKSTNSWSLEDLGAFTVANLGGLGTGVATALGNATNGSGGFLLQPGLAQYDLFESNGTTAAPVGIVCGAGTLLQGSATNPSCTATPTLGVQGTTAGSLTLAGASSTSGSITLNGYTSGSATINVSATGGLNLGTVAAGTWQGTAVAVGYGGTGDSSVTAYAPVLGGTTSTAALQSAVAGTPGQVFVSQGSSTKPTYIDFPERYYVPAANCDNTTAGNGWSIGSSGVVACRAGTNNQGGAIQITDTAGTFAQFTLTIPEDWDTSSDPYIRFYFGVVSDTTNGHTVIPQIKVSCPTAGGGTVSDDASFSAAQSSSTVTLGASAVANGFYNGSNVQIGSTQMSGCIAGGLMIVQIGRATDTVTGNVNFYGVDVTFPRQIVVQAN